MTEVDITYRMHLSDGWSLSSCALSQWHCGRELDSGVAAGHLPDLGQDPEPLWLCDIICEVIFLVLFP